MKTIFVMIPAYRDPVLEETLDNVFYNADNPENIFVAIGAQYDNTQDLDFIKKYPAKNIRMLYIHPEGRPGVYRLRHILNSLYANEDYYLSIDSHTELVKGWDTKLIDILNNQLSRKTVLVGHQGPSWGTDNYDYLSFCLSDDGNGNSRLKMGEPVSKPKPKDNSLPIGHYLPAGIFFTHGSFANEIRWGKLWQDIQEEHFTSFEAFMLGWELRVLVHENIIHHAPEKYYEHVYIGDFARLTGDRNFKDSYSMQKDNLTEVNANIIKAMLYNDGPFRLDNVVKSPSDWWEAIGLLEEFNHLCRDELLS